jgi:hypothetical protein
LAGWLAPSKISNGLDGHLDFGQRELLGQMPVGTIHGSNRRSASDLPDRAEMARHVLRRSGPIPFFTERFHNMKLSILGVGLAWLLALGVATSASAQGVQTGTIRGTVLDAQDLAIPGATVTATSPALLGQRETVTGPDGTFTLAQLPAGEYQIRFALTGFETVTRSVTVPLGGTSTQDATLRAGAVEQTVDVVGTAPPLADATIGLNIRQEEVEALATSRTLHGIATLSPGLNENTPNARQLSISGAPAWDSIFMLNGVDVNDNLFAQPQNLFIEDAIEETQVLTSGISAEYGRFSGGVVNAVTKSGGNNF